MRIDDSWRTIRHLFDQNWHRANQKAIAYGLIVLGRGWEARPADRTALLKDGLIDRLLLAPAPAACWLCPGHGM